MTVVFRDDRRKESHCQASTCWNCDLCDHIMGADMVGNSRPTGNYRNGGSLRREEQLADDNPAGHCKGSRPGQPTSGGLFWRSVRSAHRRDSIGRGHSARNKRHEIPRLQTDQDYLVRAQRESLGGLLEDQPLNRRDAALPATAQCNLVMNWSLANTAIGRSSAIQPSPYSLSLSTF